MQGDAGCLDVGCFRGTGFHTESHAHGAPRAKIPGLSVHAEAGAEDNEGGRGAWWTGLQPRWAGTRPCAARVSAMALRKDGGGPSCGARIPASTRVGLERRGEARPGIRRAWASGASGG